MEERPDTRPAIPVPGILERISDAFVALTGFMELIHPGDRPRLIATQTRLMEGGEPVSEDYRTNPDRIPFRVLNANFRALKNDGEKVVRIVGTALDITARQMAEEKVRAHLEELLRWRQVTLGREDRVRQLKCEVNELRARLGKPSRYASPETKADAPGAPETK